MTGRRELYLDLNFQHGGDIDALLSPEREARVEMLMYRERKAERREAGFVRPEDQTHYDTDGNAITGRQSSWNLTDPASFGPDNFVGPVPFWSRYKIGQIEHKPSSNTYNVPIVMGAPQTQDVFGQYTPRWFGGRMDSYYKFRVTALNDDGIREEGPESVTVRVAPYPYPIHLDGGNNTNRLGVGMADGPIFG